MIDSIPIHLPATFRGIPKRVSSLHPTIPHHPPIVRLCFGIRPGLFIANGFCNFQPRSHSAAFVGRMICWRLATGGWRVADRIKVISPAANMSNVRTSHHINPSRGGKRQNAKWIWKPDEQSFRGAGGFSFCLFSPNIFRSSGPSLLRRGRPTNRRIQRRHGATNTAWTRHDTTTTTTRRGLLHTPCSHQSVQHSRASTEQPQPQPRPFFFLRSQPGF